MAPHAKMKAQPQLLDVNRKPGQPKKRKKITLVFDENKRRDFLRGFHKRKLQRQKKAQDELQKQLKEERKRIKQDARERYKKLLSNRDIPELQQLLSQTEYETEDRTISVLELNVADLAEGSSWIGENKVMAKDEDEEEEEEEKEKNKNNSDYENDVVGMSLNGAKETADTNQNIFERERIGTKKELKKAVKKAALMRIKKSKAFQQKQNIERQKNKKESRRKLKRIQRVQKHSGKLKKKLSR